MHEKPAARVESLRSRADHDEPSVFVPESLLREARRQRRSARRRRSRRTCLLDPDGDVVRHLQADRPRPPLADLGLLPHRSLGDRASAGEPIGVVGNAVGAPFAVLVAEELFASGCELARQRHLRRPARSDLDLPCTILVDRALRGEGHQLRLPARRARYAAGDAQLLAARRDELRRSGHRRDSRRHLDDRRAVSRDPLRASPRPRPPACWRSRWKSPALYAFAQARCRPVVCFALVTNQMAQSRGRFREGTGRRRRTRPALVAAAARGWRVLRGEHALDERSRETT